ncbi:MAG TPA: TolC family protein [Flavobacteriales bacterium]|nr:TolC family protein [Flavobacteriales bacterium]HMR28698.1 TolC family protein [Flavobacteriales bacterium]
MLRTTFISAATVCCFVAAHGQTRPIDLAEVLRLAGADHLAVRDAEARAALANADAARASEWWLPDLNAGIAMHHLQGSAMNGDGRFFTDVDRASFQGGLGLNAAWRFGEGPINARAQRTEAEAMRLRTEAERNTAALDAVNTYLDLIAARAERSAYAQLAQRADSIAQQLDALVRNGLGYESDLLQAQSGQLRMQAATMQAEMQEAMLQARLVAALGMDPATVLLPTDTVLAPLALPGADRTFTDRSAFLGVRPDVLSARSGLLAAQQRKRATTTGLLLPELRLATMGSYFGGVFDPLYPTWEINGWLQWRIPLSPLLGGGELQQANARIALREVQLSRTEAEATAELRAAQEQLRIAREQVRVAAESRDLAQRAYDQTAARMRLGTARPFEIVQAQEALLQAELARVRAITGYNKGQYAVVVGVGQQP